MKKIYLPILFTFFICFISFTGSAFTIVATVTNSCPVGATGSITVTPTGGTAPYTYSLDGITWTNSNVFTSLAAFNYDVYAMDALGAIANTSALIDESDVLTATITTTPTACLYGSGGGMTITPTNGTGPYTYSIYGGSAIDDTTSGFVGSFSNLYADFYSVSITDHNYCFGGFTTTIINGDSIHATAIIHPFSCAGSGDAWMSLSFSSGTAPWTLSNLTWGTGTSSGTPNQGLGFYDPGTYLFDITDSTGCIGAVTVTVPVGLPAVTYASNDTLICTAGAAQLSGTGNATMQYTGYTWLPTTGLSDSTISNPVATPDTTTTYTLYTYVGSSAGNYCISADQVTVVVVNLQAPTVLVGDPVLRITNIQTGATYTWQQLIGSTWTDVGTGSTYTVSTFGQYRAKAANGQCEAYSTYVSTGRIASLNPFGIALFPNPTANMLNLYELKPEHNWQTLDIMNAQGLRVIPTTSIRNKTSFSTNISRLNSGIYILKLTKSDGVTTDIRFIKN